MDCQLEHVFRPREAGSHKEGLGLHDLANLASSMHGKLSAHSDGAGHGTRFVLEVPLQLVNAPAPTSAS